MANRLTLAVRSIFLAMSGPPRYHPSRRSRFRAQDSGGTRPADSTPTNPADDPTAFPSYEQPLSIPEHEANLDAPISEVASEQTLSMPEHEVDPNAPVPETMPEAWPVEVYTPETYTPSHAVPVEHDTAALTLPAAPLEAADELPRAFQLRNVYEGPAPQRRGLIAFLPDFGKRDPSWRWVLPPDICSSAHGRPVQRVVVAGVAALPGKSIIPTPLNADTQAALDAAFRRHQAAPLSGRAENVYRAPRRAPPNGRPWPSKARGTLCTRWMPRRPARSFPP